MCLLEVRFVPGRSNSELFIGSISLTQFVGLDGEPISFKTPWTVISCILRCSSVVESPTSKSKEICRRREVVSDCWIKNKLLKVSLGKRRKR